MGCRLVAKQFIPRATSHETKVPWVYNVSHVTFFAAKKKQRQILKMTIAILIGSIYGVFTPTFG